MKKEIKYVLPVLVCLLAAVFLTLPSCKKNNQPATENYTTPPSSSNPTTTPTPTSAITLKDNVVVIDSAKLVLNTDSSLLKSGVYQFNQVGSGTLPEFKAGEIIIGSKGNGYIRKIVSVTQQNPITLQTTQANMEDVFKTAKFNFSINMNDMHQKQAGDGGFLYQASNVGLYQNGPLSVVLSNGSVALDPNWKFDFSFDGTKLDYFEMSSLGSNLTANFNINLTASQAVTLAEQTLKVVSYKKYFTAWVPAGIITLPVVVELNFDLNAIYSVNINALVSRQFYYEANGTLDMGVKYQNSQWQGIYSFTPNNTFSLSPFSGNAGFTVNMALVPKVSAKLYGAAGPYASVALKEELTGKIASPSLDWDFKADAWVKTTVGANATILGTSVANYETSWETSKINYSTPGTLEKTSGDFQVAAVGQTLANPIKVRVLDSKGKSQSNVPVYFSVTSGGGSVNTASVLSDAGGYAQTNWTQGPASGPGSLNVSIKNGSGGAISGSPVSFSSNTNAALDFTYSVTNDSITTPTVYEGVINVNASGGSAPYTYSKGSGYGSNPTFNGLQGNITYTIYVKDASSTIKSKSVFVPKL